LSGEADVEIKVSRNFILAQTRDDRNDKISGLQSGKLLTKQNFREYNYTMYRIGCRE